ncbi:hypothetical protein ACLB2K_063550 [Fragaria x ananassa]
MTESVMSANRMFILLTESAKEERCLQVSTMEPSKLWHHRFGHLSYKGLCTMKSKNMMLGVPQVTDSGAICEACMKGKQHRTPIPKASRWRATERLQLVHADLCGPITPISSGKKSDNEYQLKP